MSSSDEDTKKRSSKKKSSDEGTRKRSSKKKLSSSDENMTKVSEPRSSKKKKRSSEEEGSTPKAISSSSSKEKNVNINRRFVPPSDVYKKQYVKSEQKVLDPNSDIRLGTDKAKSLNNRLMAIKQSLLELVPEFITIHLMSYEEMNNMKVWTVINKEQSGYGSVNDKRGGESNATSVCITCNEIGSVCIGHHGIMIFNNHDVDHQYN